MWAFTSRVFELNLEITLLLNKYFFLQVTYKLLSQSRKPNNQEGRLGAGGPYKRGEVGKFFEKKARPTPLDNTTS